MGDDIRLKWSLWTHPKWVLLGRRCGAEGQLTLLRLWTWVAIHRSDGRLRGLGRDEIESIAAGWPGKRGEWIKACLDLRLIDHNDDNTYSIHNWQTWQPFAAGRSDRSSAARNAVSVRKALKTKTPLLYETFIWLSPAKQRKYWRLAPPELVAKYGTYTEWRRQHIQRISADDATRLSPCPSPTPTPTPSGGEAGKGSKRAPERASGLAPSGPAARPAQGRADARGVLTVRPCESCQEESRGIVYSAVRWPEDGRPATPPCPMCELHYDLWYAKGEDAHGEDPDDRCDSS